MTQTLNAPPQAPQAAAEQDLKDLASGGLVNLVGKLGRLSRAAFMWVVALLCGLEVKGLFDTAWSIASLIQRLGRFGLQVTVVRFAVAARTAGDQDQVERVLAAALRLGTLASGAVLLGAWLAAERIAAFYEVPIAGAVRLMALATPFLTWAWIFVAATRALRIMRYDVYVMSIAGPLLLLAGSVVTGLAGWGLDGLAWANLVMAVGSCLLAVHYFGHFYSLRGCLGRLRQTLPWGSMGRFSLPVTATDTIYGVLSNLDVLMLSWLLAGSPKEVMAQVGIYALARNIAGAMLKAPQSLDPIFSPIASELSARDQHHALGHRFAAISGWILTINLPMCAAILLAGDALLQVLGQGQAAYLHAGLEAMGVLCIAMMAQGLFTMVDPVLTMAGRPYLNMFNNCLWLALNALLNLWLIPALGMAGAAWAAALSALAAGALRLVQLYLIHHILPFSRSQLKPLLAALAGTLAGWLCREVAPTGAAWSLALTLGAFLAVYGAALVALGLSPEDRLMLQRAKAPFNRLFGRLEVKP
ncbi:MAG: polysaccharide biosynthesis C-terminal domain-containing protein [Candidatus Handelsmanbacteria bacterium]|nr:polysaccharide biosynthesis C-terminal domain-containing protein [Candidatus Handelsmanbacteria bacterium]